MNKPKNMLSEKAYTEELLKPFVSEEFVMDLQLFGKGGGKSAGKLLLTAGAFFLGAGGIGQTIFGANSFASGVMAASLVGTIWNMATSRRGLGQNNSPSIQRFDKAQESMSSTGQIPVVYGMRKISGNQTYHWTNAAQNQLKKHVVLCEGGIEGIVSVCANDLIIPTGTQAKGTVFTIQNTKYQDSRVWKEGKTLHLYADGKEEKIYLCNKDDAENADTYFEWQVNTGSLISYINRMNKGWQAFPYASSSKYPGDLTVEDKACYLNPASATASTVIGGTNYKFHDCEAPSNYEEVGGYPHLAWLEMTFNSSQELNGNPSVDCIVKGRKIYDPRTKKTAYSDNPALCVLDFLTNKRYGLGRWVSMDDIDLDSFIQSANYCDQKITVYDANDNPIRSKRYTLNMIIDQRQDASKWLEDMLANFSAWLVISKDKIKLMVEQPSPVVHKFNDDNIVSMTITPLKASETPNSYEISLCDPGSNWRVIQVICSDHADIKQRGKVITKQVELSGVTSQSQALRLARFYSDYNLACPIVVSFKTGIEAMALEPGDVVTVSYRDALKNMPVRISEIKETDDNEFEITARQYNGSIYGDIMGGGVQTKSYVVAKDPADEDSPYFSLCNVTNLKAVSQHRRKSDGSVAYDIMVTFDLPKQYAINSARVYYKNNNAPLSEVGRIKQGTKGTEVGYLSKWKCAGESTGVMKIPNVKIGDRYKIRVAVRSRKGKEQDINDCPEVICRVTKRPTVPPQPHNLQFDFTQDFTFFWNDVADSDVLYYELRTDANKGVTAGLLARVVSPRATVKIPSRRGTAYVYAINGQKKYSHPAKCEWNYPKPAAPDKIEFNETPLGVTIMLPFFPVGIEKARLFITGTSSSDKIDILNPSYEFKGEPSIYTLRACYVDRMGEGDMSGEYDFAVNPTFKPEWIKDSSISLEKMDKSVMETVERAKKSAEDILSIGDKITKLEEKDGEIKSLITDPDKGVASQIKQLAESIDSTVANKVQGVESSVQQEAGRITNIVTSLGYKSIEELGKSVKDTEALKKAEKAAIDAEQAVRTAGAKATAAQLKDATDKRQKFNDLMDSYRETYPYSAITQLLDGINLRVAKGDIINQINMTAQGTTIKGQYLNIDATTKIGNNIISGDMIKAKAITAEKMKVDRLSAICGTIGTFKSANAGARVEIKDSLIQVFDAKGNLRVKLGVW